MCSQTLINLCLDTIVSNFSKYNSLFTITKDDNIKRRFEFLQRKYSFDILSRLTAEEGLLEEQYVDLLINRYLKVLDTSWLENCSWEKVISKIAEIGSNIEKLFFTIAKITDETPWQDTLSYFSNLKSFIFHCENPDTKCENLIFKHVAIFCPNIEDIDMKLSGVSSEVVRYLCKSEAGEPLCTRLKKLDIRGTQIKYDDVTYLLKNLPSLENICYDYLHFVLYLMHKNDISSLDKVTPYKINTLNLNACAFDTSYVKIREVCLAVCPYLKSLSCCLIKNDEMDFLSPLPHLVKFNIGNASSSRINVDKLFRCLCGQITSLTIGFCTISLSVLCESCLHLEELKVNRILFLLDNDSKPRFNSLFSLRFSYCNVSKNIEAINLLLTSSEKLESLIFVACDLSSSEIKTSIFKCCETYRIRMLYFRDSVIEKDFVKELLLNCHTLNCLNIGECLKKYKHDLLKFTEKLPNKVTICVVDSDSEDDFYNDAEESDDSDESYDDDYDYLYDNISMFNY